MHKARLNQQRPVNARLDPKDGVISDKGVAHLYPLTNIYSGPTRDLEPQQ